MRTVLSLFILVNCLFSKISIAQYNNNIWVVGYDAFTWEFQKDSIKGSVYLTPPFWGSNPFTVAHSNIQDSTGLLFSCNGFYIYNKHGEAMDPSPIVPSKFVLSRNHRSDMVQQTLIIPMKDNKYVVFATGMSDANYDIVASGGKNMFDVFNYTMIDMNKNGGLGAIASKFNYLIENDSLSVCQTSAVRHANGRDWWVIKPHASKHLFHTFLVTPDSVIKQPIQAFDSPPFTNGVIGQSNFSMDGSLYVMSSGFSTEYTQVNYFDRCTGKMTKFKSIPRQFDSVWQDYAWISGVAFSPNNRFLYLINNLHIVQYDLQTDERIELITDSIYNPAGYTVAYNAPYGKIYIGNYHEIQNKMSYIEFPNEKGLAAGLCQLCYTTPNQAAKAPPNLPNYELGALKGSACDTLNKPTLPVYSSIKLYPNPVNSNLSIELPSSTKKYELVIFNMLGEVVFRKKEEEIKQHKITLTLWHLSRGLYTIKIVTDREQYVGKVLKE